MKRSSVILMASYLTLWSQNWGFEYVKGKYFDADSETDEFLVKILLTMLMLDVCFAKDFFYRFQWKNLNWMNNVWVLRSLWLCCSRVWFMDLWLLQMNDATSFFFLIQIYLIPLMFISIFVKGMTVYACISYLSTNSIFSY